MGESRFDEAVQTAWGKFESLLEESLAQLGDGSMVIDVEAETTGDGTTPYVQFAGDDEWIRGEVSSNGFLDEACRLDKVQRRALRALGWQRPDDDHPNFWVDVRRDEVELLRTMAVGALRQALGVVHPRFLSWVADGTPTSEDQDVFEHELGFPSDAAELRTMVTATVGHHLGLETVKTDDDGDIPISSGKVPLWVRVLEDSPTVRIFSHVVVQVLSARQARIEADILNRQYHHVKFTVVDRTIVATTDLVGSPFVAQHVRDAMDNLGSVLNDIVEDTALRTGGRLFFSSVKTPPNRPSA